MPLNDVTLDRIAQRLIAQVGTLGRRLSIRTVDRLGDANLLSQPTRGCGTVLVTATVVATSLS